LPGRADECRPGALDGLITPAGQRRAVWWAYRWYAVTRDRRVRSDSTDDGVAALASAGPPVRVLLGRAARGASRPLDLELVVRGLGLDRARAVIERAPDLGTQALQQPRRAVLRGLDVSHGEARVGVPRLRPYEAALVTVLPG
jgi:hypothetical protein